MEAVCEHVYMNSCLCVNPVAHVSQFCTSVLSFQKGSLFAVHHSKETNLVLKMCLVFCWNLSRLND